MKSKKSAKTAKTKGKVEKRGSKMPQVKTLGRELNGITLISQLGGNFGYVTATRNKKNPWRAESKDGLNIAFGQSKELALQNLIDGINNRKSQE